MSAYRDMVSRFADKDAQVLGVSTDSIEKQTKFAESLKLPFPLLADHDGKVTLSYGISRAGFAARTTFVVGRDGRIEKILRGSEALDPTGALEACPSKPTGPNANDPI